MKKLIFIFCLLFLSLKTECFSCESFDYIVYDANTNEIIFEFAKDIKYLKESDEYEMNVYIDGVKGYIVVRGRNFKIIGPEGELNLKNKDN